MNGREEKESGNRAILSDSKQFLKKIAQSDTLYAQYDSFAIYRIDALFLVAHSISFTKNKKITIQAITLNLLCFFHYNTIIKKQIWSAKMEKLKILLAKGRIYESVYELLNDVGISIHLPDRTYFPVTNQDDLAFQVVKPQITSALLAKNCADVGFSGKDWVYENGVENDVEEIMDLGFDPVRIVAAIPETKDYEKLLKGKVTIATEYQNLTKKYIDSKKIEGTIFRTWGTSEGFVQDNDDALAQILIDNTSTGSSLRANRLKIVDTLMESSTRMYASKEAMKNPSKKQKILELKMLFEAVLAARSRVMLEMNVAKADFDGLIKGIPSMKSPTVSPLFGDDGYAVKIAVKKSEVPTLLPKLQSLGATDILEYELRKVML